MSKRVIVVKRQEPEGEWPEICQRAKTTPMPQEDVPTCEQCGRVWDGVPHPPCDG